VSQRGSAPILPLVIAAVLGVGLSASAYLNYVQHQHAADIARQLNGQITDLRYQLGLDTKGSPSPSPEASASPLAATPTPEAVLGSQSLSLTELGIKLTATAPLADLSYAMIPATTSGATVAGLTSAGFVAKHPACGPGTALGQLVRRDKGAKAPSSNKLIVTLGNYSFYYYLPATTCAASPADKADVATYQAALQNTIFKTIAQ
jgi:hypothetical protein